ncbi:MAG: glycosyltransferase family 39 protein [Alphaproteobacteria bacterium]|nr:glycosyltransferase family 39 protein [Alphaproteobacteria bacterium]
MALAVAFILMASCLGLGLLLLRSLGLLTTILGMERLAWAWSIGYGLLGTVLFPAALMGFVTPLALGLLLLPGLAGLALLGRLSLPTPTRSEMGLIAVLALVFLLLLAVGLAPPADADSLAYHFARPRVILNEGVLTFVPSAVEGAIPLLIHLTYLPALALGGEQGLTLWASLSGIASVLSVGLISKRWLSDCWALALTLALITTPAFLYGLGSGQVEVRVVAFVFFSILALDEGRRRKDLRWVLLAGLLAGCFAAAKYFGLFFLAAGGLLCLMHGRWIAAGLIFSLGGLLSGAPVYFWNWIQSGDPLFPVLFQFLGLADSALWTKEQAAYFQTYYSSTEKPAPVTLGLLLTYPFKATLDGLTGWESARTGMGPLWLLLLPFSLAALRERLLILARHPLALLTLAVFVFYAFWILLGASQRVRHLVPVYPCLLVALLVAAERAKQFRKPVLAALALTILVQTAGLFLYARPALAFHLGDANRQDYLHRNVVHYGAAAWVNQHLTPTDHLLFFERQLTFYIDIPAFYASSAYQAQINFRDGEPDDFAQRWRQMQQLGLSHLMIVPGLDDPKTDNPQSRTAAAFLWAGCAKRLASIPVTLFQSRTLPELGITRWEADIFRLTPDECNQDSLRLANPASRGYNLLDSQR